MKRTLNFDFPVKALTDEVLKDETGKNVNAGRFLADSMAMEMLEDKKMVVKYMQWSIELYKTGIIEVDEADATMIEDFISKSRRMIALIKYQLLQAVSGNEDSNGKNAKQAKK